jgi:ribosomal protein L44E
VVENRHQYDGDNRPGEKIFGKIVQISFLEFTCSLCGEAHLAIIYFTNLLDQVSLGQQIHFPASWS